MRLFVTGGSGFIGSAVVPELRGAGHEVVGLARSDASAAALAAAGAEVLRGDLEDLDSLRLGATESDGVIHLGYVHDFSDMSIGAAVDLQAIEAIGETLAGSGKPFVITTGTLLLALGDVGLSPGTFGTEDGRVALCRHAAGDIGEYRHRLGGEGRPLCGHPPLADGARSGRPRLRPDPDRHCTGEGRVGLRGRRRQSVARSAPTRRGAALPAGCRGGTGGHALARCRRRGGAVPRHRRGHRTPPRRAGAQHPAGGGGRGTSGSWAAWCRRTTRPRTP